MKVVLSRFAYVRRDGDTAVVESPEAFCRIVFLCSEIWNWFPAAGGIHELEAYGDSRYLVRDSFTVADILAIHVILWAKSARLALGSDNLEPYPQTLTARDAFKRARQVAAAPEPASPGRN
jgi:hypothetical protein